MLNSYSLKYKINSTKHTNISNSNLSRDFRYITILHILSLLFSSNSNFDPKPYIYFLNNRLVNHRYKFLSISLTISLSYFYLLSFIFDHSFIYTYLYYFHFQDLSTIGPLINYLNYFV